jgi:peroxisomal membrane protein 4
MGKLFKFNFMSVDGPFSPGTHSLLPASMAGHPERPYHALVAGAVGGYFVWGRYSSVNHQIILYLTSRVLIGVSKRLWEHYHGHPENGASWSSSHIQGNSSRSSSRAASLLDHPQTYPFLAATVWGLVMVLFEESPHVLHKSLKQSMDEIYRYQLSTAVSDVSASAGAAGAPTAGG